MKPFKTKSKVLSLMLLLIFVSTFLIVGCSNESGSTKTGENNSTENNTSDKEEANKSGDKYGGDLTVSLPFGTVNLGYPAEQLASDPMIYAIPVLETLARFDKTGDLTPLLAEKWETDSTAKTITYHLKKNVKFHDGTDFNAEALKWNIEQYIATQRPETRGIASMEAKDDHTLVITLEEWDSSRLASIAFYVQIISPKSFEENGKEWAIKNPIGTGPFTIKKWETNVSVEYVKNENYWQEGKPYLDSIKYIEFKDPVTAASSFKAGEVDVLKASETTIKDLVNGQNYSVVKNESGVGVVGTGIIADSANPDSPFSDVKVRQALGHAIDSEAINKVINNGYGTVINQWGSENSWAYNPEVDGYPYDPEKAKELLEEAGYPDGFKTKMYGGPGFDALSTAIQNYLSEVGIQAEIEMIDAAKGNEMMTGKWDGLYWWFFTASPDLPFYMSRHMDPEGTFYAKNIIHPQNLLDKLDEMRKAESFETQQALAKEIQEIVFEEHAIGYPLYLQANIFTKYNYVKDDGFNITSTNTWTPENVWIDK